MTVAAGVRQVLRRYVPFGPASGRAKAARLPIALVVAWGALFLNVLPPSANETVVPFSHTAGQMVAQGSLGLALLFALLVNPRLVVRPNLFLLLLSVMAVMALVVSIHSPYLLGSTYRGLRLITFVGCLWLLTPWWGRPDMALLRVHRLCIGAALVSVLVGAAAAPGKAFSFEGRLSGALWPITSPQTAHFAAVLLGTSAILWMCRTVSGGHALVGIVVGAGVLVGTHTRTGLLGTVVGLVVASASLFLGHARVRHASVSTIALAIAGGTLFAPQLASWLARGQTRQQASELTGRTNIWEASLAEHRSFIGELFGSGLSNKSFDGNPIDSSWVATYLELGWFGVTVEVVFMLALLGMAVTRPQGARRAVALFLISYCIVSSITETGLGDASTYLLDLAVAASLVVQAPTRARS
jgi:hypothetical protein